MLCEPPQRGLPEAVGNAFSREARRLSGPRNQNGERSARDRAAMPVAYEIDALRWSSLDRARQGGVQRDENLNAS